LVTYRDGLHVSRQSLVQVVSYRTLRKCRATALIDTNVLPLHDATTHDNVGKVPAHCSYAGRYTISLPSHYRCRQKRLLRPCHHWRSAHVIFLSIAGHVTVCCVVSSLFPFTMTANQRRVSGLCGRHVIRLSTGLLRVIPSDRVDAAIITKTF